MQKETLAMPKLNEEALKRAGLPHLRFLYAIAELPYVEAIYLFGSRARGDHWKNSDIGMAIKYSDDDKWHRKVVDAIVAETADTFLDIDCVDYNKELNPKFRNFIEVDKVILYERA